MHHRSVPVLHEAIIATARAYVLVGAAYLFAVGPNHTGPTLAIFRIGGHRNGAETPWACAAREAAEEACVGAGVLWYTSSALLPIEKTPPLCSDNSCTMPYTGCRLKPIRQSSS